MQLRYLHTSLTGLKPENVGNQDRYVVAVSEYGVVAVLADGLGSAAHSAEGAVVATTCFSEILLGELQSQGDIREILSGDSMQRVWLNSIAQLERAGEYSCTCSIVVIDYFRHQVILAQLGDSMVWTSSDVGRSELEHSEGKFLNETVCLGPQILPFNVQVVPWKQSAQFVLTSDGIGEEILQEKLSELVAYFQHRYPKCNEQEQADFSNEILSVFGDLNSDDKTIVIGWIQ